MPESAKLRRLRAIRDKLSAGKLEDHELKGAVFAGVDRETVRLSDPDALEQLEARIAAEESLEG